MQPSGTTKRLPVLIFPGFMSSGLEATESNIYKNSHASEKNKSGGGNNNRRVWLNIKSAGFDSLYFGGALKSNEDKRENGETYDEELHEEYKKEFRCKSNWMQHLKLSDDLHSDPPGIKALFEVGYQQGVDLDAAPYDWRIPPSLLERRDSYFTNTMRQVERLYQQNGDTPVVLLCHSMGCKACHYFLNFAKTQSGGQEWLDKYVHTYFVVGAPHLGAPKSLRSTLLGDRMGLEAFLSEEEALICARTWGSVPWLYPHVLPEGIPPIVYLRRAGVLHVKVLPFDCHKMLSDRRTKPSRLKLAVTYQNQTFRSKFHPTQDSDDDKFPVSFSETFSFATPASLPVSGDAQLRISLYEPGFQAGKTCCQSGAFSWIRNTVQCVIDKVFPVGFWRRIGLLTRDDTLRTAVEGATVTAGNVATTALGSAALLADSEEKDITEVLSDPSTAAECSLLLRFGDLTKLKSDLRKGKPHKNIVFGETSSIAVKVLVEWKPPAYDIDSTTLSDVRVAHPTENAQSLNIHHRRDNNVRYEPANGVQLMINEFTPRHKELLHEFYLPDPIGPQTLSSRDPPPVKRVKAVYGIDLPTEIAAVYRRRTLVQEEGRMKCMQELDPDSRLDKKCGFKMQDGSILETEETPRNMYDATQGKDVVVRRSGDGTVPYFSLQQCRKWQEHCDVEIHELRFAEHREILADKRFLKILLDYVRMNQS